MTDDRTTPRRYRRRFADRRLVERVLAGEPLAGRQLHERLTRSICWRAEQHPHPDDLAQDVWRVLFDRDARRLRAYDPGRASLETYVAQVARSVVANDLARARRRGAEAFIDPHDASEVVAVDPTNRLMARDAIARLWDRLTTALRPIELQAITLTFVDGLTAVEAGARLKISPQLVHNYRLKARRLVEAWRADCLR